MRNETERNEQNLNEIINARTEQLEPELMSRLARIARREKVEIRIEIDIEPID